MQKVQFVFYFRNSGKLSNNIDTNFLYYVQAVELLLPKRVLPTIIEMIDHTEIELTTVNSYVL